MLEKFEALYGPEHYEVVVNLNNLANVRYALGDTAAAERLMRRALTAKENTLGAGHPDTALTANNLGVILQTMGQTDEARVLFTRALVAFQATVGEAHPQDADGAREFGGAGRGKEKGEELKIPRWRQQVAERPAGRKTDSARRAFGAKRLQRVVFNHSDTRRRKNKRAVLLDLPFASRFRDVKRSRIVVPVHLVWSTKNREPWIVPTIERRLHRVLVAEAQAQKAQVLAIGGMPDHVHLAILFPATVSLAILMKQLKGASSALVTAELCPETGGHWQEGYGAFGFHVGLTDRVIGYIKNQKTHHQDATLWPNLETTNEEIAPNLPAPGGRSARSASSEEFSTPRPPRPKEEAQ